MDDEEGQKRAIIETAAKLIKTDAKTMVQTITDEYPTPSDLTLASALQFIPSSLRYMLQTLFAGKDTERKEASIGQSIVQAVRPRTVIAPLRLGLAVQMHHHFRSRFLKDSFSSMDYCSSYSQVQKFEHNAASSVSPAVFGGSIVVVKSTLLFAADNADHNIATLDGKNTFHGMGMITTITPSKVVSHIVPRQKIVGLKIVDQTKAELPTNISSCS